MVTNYQFTLHNIPEEQRSHLQCGRSVKFTNYPYYCHFPGLEFI